MTGSNDRRRGHEISDFVIAGNYRISQVRQQRQVKDSVSHNALTQVPRLRNTEQVRT
jgi:hypothetical protein